MVDDLIQARILVGLQRGRQGSIYLTLDLRKLNIAAVPCVTAKSNHLIGSNKCFYCNVFSYDDAMSSAESASTKEMESEDSWTFNFLQQ